ncbi:MAG: hypothetical protein ABJF11_07630 [Reichenbachiella sp.]|uniref:hypothetical protein n=1 Tax=Reichenbachiella sp. TaxID=2184521 RepID=UPI0032673F49
MNKSFLFVLLILSSCLSPDKIKLEADTEITVLDQLLLSTATKPKDCTINKRVKLDDIEESNETLPYDTLLILKDLNVLRDYALARQITTANYSKVKSDNKITYKRKASERKGPVVVRISKDGDVIAQVSLNFEENNLLYKSERQLLMKFDTNELVEYKITGKRKLIGLHSSEYEIEVKINSKF